MASRFFETLFRVPGQAVDQNQLDHYAVPHPDCRVITRVFSIKVRPNLKASMVAQPPPRDIF